MRSSWEVFRFEVWIQVRRPSTWLFAAALLALAVRLATELYVDDARSAGIPFNTPFAIANVTLLCSMVGLLVVAAVAGAAATRDVQTRMAPLLYTAPLSKGAYLGGRFLAAFAVSGLLLAAVPLGQVLATYLPGLEAGLVAPFLPGAYVGPYALLALPNAFVATALLFSAAALSRRAITSYVGAAFLFVGALFTGVFVAKHLGQWELAKWLDPLGLVVLSELSKAWTPVEQETLLIGLDGSLLSNRLVWLGVSLSALALTHFRFRFAHDTAGRRRGRDMRRRDAHSSMPRPAGIAQSVPVAVPPVRRTFGLATHARQALAVAGRSFREIVTSWGALGLAAVAVLLVLSGPAQMAHMGVPLVPTTELITSFLVASQDVIGMIAPLLTAFYAGELVWGERDAGLSPIADATPVPDGVPFIGKLLGLSLVLATFQALMMAAGMLSQAILGYHAFEVGLYLRVLFGLQLADYLLFAVLALAVHVVVDQKVVGHLVVLVVYAFLAFAPSLGVEHHLLVYGSDPGWAYSDMRGFEPFLAPWVWFKLYWAAWALLLAVLAVLFWVRGRRDGLRARLQLAWHRVTGLMPWGAAAVALTLVLGEFVFANTNFLYDYRTAADGQAWRAEYERRYGRHEGAAQPVLAGTRLHVELYPERREATVRGTYRLVNESAAMIDTLHLTTASGVETGRVVFDRPAAHVLTDAEFGHRTYVLDAPLRPGDSLGLRFEVRFGPRGFSNDGVDASVVANGTHIVAQDWLPTIGYTRGRELAAAGDRRAHGLPPQPAVRPLHDVAARGGRAGGERIAFEAVVGTAEGQVAVAPGAIRRTWTESGRRYVHYATDAPIRNDYAIFSAAYAVREAEWRAPGSGPAQTVQIQIFHHPGHSWNVDRMVRGVRASLDYFTEHFGPYPHRHLRLVEYPDPGNALHSAPVNIWYKEGFSLFDPERDARGIDFPFAVVAHEVAHQWWGNQLVPADVEGAALLSESLAWYGAMGVVEEAYGSDHLRRLLDAMRRDAYQTPRARAGAPLLRAADFFEAHRKGPFAMVALREYIGAERVNAALRSLLRRYGSGEPPLPVSLDLYRELQAVTPDSLRSLLADLFERNTFWELEATRATAVPTGSGAWRVTLGVTARKVTVDSTGVETEVPMDNLVEIGVYAASEDEDGVGEPLYRRLHRLRSGEQTVTVAVPREPASAGVDPRHLLIDTDPDDNLVDTVGPKDRGRSAG